MFFNSFLGHPQKLFRGLMHGVRQNFSNQDQSWSWSRLEIWFEDMSWYWSQKGKNKFQEAC